jgi:hypothetical protein
VSTVTRVEPIDTFVSAVIRNDLSRTAQSQAVAAFARRELTEAQQANSRALGRVPRHETFVDGRRGAALESVRPNGGTILFSFELVDDVLRWIFAELRRRSPVVSGRYRDSHQVFADGREIALTAIPEASEYTLSNSALYARRLEVGRTRAGRAFVVQVPNRIYQRTAADASRRFGNIAKITFGFRAAVPTIIVTVR